MMMMMLMMMMMMIRIWRALPSHHNLTTLLRLQEDILCTCQDFVLQNSTLVQLNYQSYGPRCRAQFRDRVPQIDLRIILETFRPLQCAENSELQAPTHCL